MNARARRAITSLALLAAGLVGGGVVLGFAPAAGAATCTSAGGVSVVVDYRELGGGTFTACAADGGGKSATAIVASVGVQLTYASRQPGFVCRVNGQPASDPCVNASPANAYWGLWWADGSKGSWTYSSYASGSPDRPRRRLGRLVVAAGPRGQRSRASRRRPARAVEHPDRDAHADVVAELVAHLVARRRRPRRRRVAEGRSRPARRLVRRRARAAAARAAARAAADPVRPARARRPGSTPSGSPDEPVRVPAGQ